MTKEPLKKITIRHDVSDTFDPIKDEVEGYTLGTLRDAINTLITEYGENADLSAEIEGDDYYSSWVWVVIEERLETPAEQKIRLKEEAQWAKEQKKWELQKEKEEKKLYLELKKKYENLVKPEEC